MTRLSGELVAEIYGTLRDYNNKRIHSALNMPPVVFANPYCFRGSRSLRDCSHRKPRLSYQQHSESAGPCRQLSSWQWALSKQLSI